jgi:hypothetical protein
MDITKIFDFDENSTKTNLLYKTELRQKIEYVFKHLFENKRVPINKLKKDNSFDFSELKFSEGKNYDWFFLVNDNVTLLVRQYRTHFTMFSKTKIEGQDSYFQKVKVFTMLFDTDKMDDDLSDSYCDNKFIGLSELLPSLIELIKEDNVHSLWNDYSFKREKYVKVENVYNGGDDVSNLELLLFACDELFQKYLVSYAENEMLDKIKTLKVGDKFGRNYVIKNIKTEVKDDYYHAVGMSFFDDDDKKEDKWADVYSLTRWYYKDLNYNNMTEVVEKFVYQNYQPLFDEMCQNKVFGFVFVSHFIGALHKKFNATNEIDYKDFRNILPKKFEDFIEQLYYIKHFS